MREEGAVHVLISATGEGEPKARRLQAVLPRSPGAITGAVVTQSPGLVKQPIKQSRGPVMSAAPDLFLRLPEWLSMSLCSQRQGGGLLESWYATN